MNARTTRDLCGSKHTSWMAYQVVLILVEGYSTPRLKLTFTRTIGKKASISCLQEEFSFPNWSGILLPWWSTAVRPQLCIVSLLCNCYRNVSQALCTPRLCDSWSWFGSLPARCLPSVFAFPQSVSPSVLWGPTQACANQDYSRVGHHRGYTISWFCHVILESVSL